MKNPFGAGSFLPGSLLYLIPLALIASPFLGTASATTWIGQVTDQHCTPEHKALPGDDERCVVFIANDRQVYTIQNQDAVQKHAGHEVAITGTLDEEMVIGISYETQGIIHVDSLSMITPIELGPEDQAQFQTWMKGMQPKVIAVRNVIVAKDKTPLPAETAKLAAAFEEVGIFLGKQHSEDGAKFADSARDAAKALGAAPTQVEQILALRKVNEACAGCHLAHRAVLFGQR
jgi:hypothetical protein